FTAFGQTVPPAKTRKRRVERADGPAVAIANFSRSGFCHMLQLLFAVIFAPNPVIRKRNPKGGNLCSARRLVRCQARLLRSACCRLRVAAQKRKARFSKMDRCLAQT